MEDAPREKAISTSHMDVGVISEFIYDQKIASGATNVCLLERFPPPVRSHSYFLSQSYFRSLSTSSISQSLFLLPHLVRPYRPHNYIPPSSPARYPVSHKTIVRSGTESKVKSLQGPSEGGLPWHPE